MKQNARCMLCSLKMLVYVMLWSVPFINTVISITCDETAYSSDEICNPLHIIQKRLILLNNMLCPTVSDFMYHSLDSCSFIFLKVYLQKLNILMLSVEADSIRPLLWGQIHNENIQLIQNKSTTMRYFLKHEYYEIQRDRC